MAELKQAISQSASDTPRVTEQAAEVLNPYSTSELPEVLPTAGASELADAVPTAGVSELPGELPEVLPTAGASELADAVPTAGVSELPEVLPTAGASELADAVPTAGASELPVELPFSTPESDTTLTSPSVSDYTLAPNRVPAFDSATDAPSPLTGEALARRLGVAPASISRNKKKDNFAVWTSIHDPDGISWRFDGQTFQRVPSSPPA